MMELTGHSALFRITTLIAQKGTGTVLAKLDLENAYRIVPIHPDN